jgi:CheY-like chemotaxis protein
MGSSTEAQSTEAQSTEARHVDYERVGKITTPNRPSTDRQATNRTLVSAVVKTGYSSNLTVLVADDAVEVAKRVVALLEDEGVKVIGPARDGDEALELFNTLRPDVAVLDVSMPGLTGVEVARAIRETGGRCAIVMFTNHIEPSFAEECFAAGADHVLSKARDSDRLVELVRELLASAGGNSRA